MIINLKLADKREALTVYLHLLTRFHKLSEKELEVAVEIILAYFEYLALYQSKEAAVKLYLEKDSRVAIRSRLGNMNQQVFNNYLTVLKKKKVIEEGWGLNKVLLPDMNNISLTINCLYEQQKLE